MCEIIQELRYEARLEGHSEGLDEARTHTALEMLRDNKPLEEIVKYSHLPQERIEALAQKLQ